jgi:hypothetical protein
MRPPDMTRPTEPGGDVGLEESTAVWVGTHENYTAEQDLVQVGQGAVGGLKTFSEIVRASTPADLLLMAALHRQYAPQENLPADVQRAIGRAWMERARGGR